MLQECADLDDDMGEDGVKPSVPPLAAAEASTGGPAQAAVASPAAHAAAAAAPAATAASFATAPPAAQASVSPSPAAVVKPIASIFMKPQPKAAKVPAVPAAAAKAAKAPAVVPATAASPSLAGPKSKAVAAGRRKGAAVEEDGVESGSDGEEIEEEEEEGAAGASKPVGKAVQKQKADATKVRERGGEGRGCFGLPHAREAGCTGMQEGRTGMQEALVWMVWMDSPHPYRLARGLPSMCVDSLWITAHKFSHSPPRWMAWGWARWPLPRSTLRSASIPW